MANKPKYGRVRYDFPVTDYAAKYLLDGIYLGELCWANGRKDAGDFRMLLKNRGSDSLNFVLWDMIFIKQEDIRNKGSQERFSLMKYIAEQACIGYQPHPIGRVVSFRMTEMYRLRALTKKVLDSGWEGLVVRNMDQPYVDGQTVNWIKIKEEF